MKNKIFLILGMFVLFIAAYDAVGQESGSTTANRNTRSLSTLLRSARSETQTWDRGTEIQRNYRVYWLNPSLKDELIQAVNDAGFSQVWSIEGTNDRDINAGLLWWCVPADHARYDYELKFSEPGNIALYTFGFRELPIMNGVRWRVVQNSPFLNTSRSLSSISYGNGRYIAVTEHPIGSSVGVMAHSSNGITWTRTNESRMFHEIAFDGNKFVAGLNRGGNRSFHSNDGITWTESPGNVLSTVGVTGGTVFLGIRSYVGGMFFATGGIQGPNRSFWHDRISYSRDGITWTAIEDRTILSYQIEKIVYGNGRFIAHGLNNRNNHRGELLTSTDGITWTRISDTKFGESSIGDIAFGNGRFVAGGAGGKITYSNDGITWTEVRDSTLSHGIRSIAYGGGRFVAMTQNEGSEFGYLAHSTDGIRWNKVEGRLSSSVIPRRIVYVGDMFFVFGDEGTIWYWNGRR